MDADRIIEATLAPPERSDPHPLAEWVHTRDTAHMIAWAVNGTPPPALRGRSPSRRGPVAPTPLMGAQDRDSFFANLRDAVEAAAQGGDTLLRGLARGFEESPGYVDLYAHSLWALLTAHTWLPQASPALARSLAGRVARILDAGVISPRSRRELGAVPYVLRDQPH
ncbi:hypothetical protein MOV08_20570 [Streptomyces yunnanensis]|uniref:Uncharacterized protein n=1 Tax=Streptomyces yunnanensis TaxID=156453 RepID=A0ABY8A8W1_9ACTN|nr:hypothetical protein [Streptomyces yunnanensis]WEB41425.1 hypothetical protein MOV08_20570 [Streptomyces yunnanensis]